MTEEKELRWHHQLSRHPIEQTLGDSERQGSMVCSSPWGCKESDMIYQLNNNNNNCYSNTLPPIQWHKATQMYHLTVLEVRTPKPSAWG